MTDTGDASADRAGLARIESQLASDDRLARLEAQQAAIQATLSERRIAETEAAEAIQRKLEETAKAAADALKSALTSANDIELERVGRVNDRIGSVEKAAEVALATADKAVTLTREDGIRTEQKQNEFRGALEDQAKRVELTMMPRKEFEAAHTAALAQITQGREESRTESVHMREELGAIRQTVAVGPPALRSLQAGADHSAGQKQSQSVTVDRVFAAVMALIATASVVALILH